MWNCFSVSMQESLIIGQPRLDFAWAFYNLTIKEKYFVDQNRLEKESSVKKQVKK